MFVYLCVGLKKCSLDQASLAIDDKTRSNIFLSGDMEFQAVPYKPVLPEDPGLFAIRIKKNKTDPDP